MRDKEIMGLADAGLWKFWPCQSSVYRLVTSPQVYVNSSHLDVAPASPPQVSLISGAWSSLQLEVVVAAMVPAQDCPDCEGSRVLGFVYSITRASNPQLHFGNPDILI
ncbi:hypothetical protein Tco_1170993 [Tanacetum coccineum]